jgi:phosphatidylglycerophosphate synthase
MSILANRVHRQFTAAQNARWSVAVCLIATTGFAWTAGWLLDLGRLFPLKAILIFGFGATLILALAKKHLVSDRFGTANRVTLARAAMAALLLALIGERASSAEAWFAVILASLVITMDGVDGWLARSRGDTSDFGARFDMETDALLIFGMAALVWQYGKAGPWILAAGLMRYVFVASSYLLPWMRRTLPKRRGRQTICVVAALSLTVCLAPPLLPPVSDVVALAGLALLSSSFAIDIAWLRRVAGRPSLK